MERLDKFISNNSPLSRSEVRKAIQSGKVTVNGEKEGRADRQMTGDEEVRLEGGLIGKKGFTYLVMNKPTGVICSTEDPKEKTVIDILPEEYRHSGLSPAGRLDKDTTGLVLLTDDGDLIHSIISPKKHSTKQYEVTLARPFEEAYIKTFQEGVTLSDGTRCCSAALRQTGDRTCSLNITAGRCHQVKRMFAAVGNHVEALHRSAIGSYFLQGIEPGSFVVLLHNETAKFLDKSERFFGS
jgi:16S rRNA pseudouridine516 synthase